MIALTVLCSSIFHLAISLFLFLHTINLLFIAIKSTAFKHHYINLIDNHIAQSRSDSAWKCTIDISFSNRIWFLNRTCAHHRHHESFYSFILLSLLLWHLLKQFYLYLLFGFGSIFSHYFFDPNRLRLIRLFIIQDEL